MSVPNPTLPPYTDDTVRVCLLNDEYLSEYGGRLPAGSAVEVSPQVAAKWIKLEIAVPGREGDLTLREKKRAELAALQAEIDALGASAEADQGVVPTAVRAGRAGREHST